MTLWQTHACQRWVSTLTRRVSDTRVSECLTRVCQRWNVECQTHELTLACQRVSVVTRVSACQRWHSRASVSALTHACQTLWHACVCQSVMYVFVFDHNNGWSGSTPPSTAGMVENEYQKRWEEIPSLPRNADTLRVCVDTQLWHADTLTRVCQRWHASVNADTRVSTLTRECQRWHTRVRHSDTRVSDTLRVSVDTQRWHACVCQCI